MYSRQISGDTTKSKTVEQKKVKPEDKFKEEVPEKLKYFKEKYEANFDAPFEIVFKAIKKSITDINCMISKQSYSQNENGLYKGIVRSDACLFTEGSDSSFTVLGKYSINMPIIRGGDWVNGRMMYKFTITELENGKVYLLLKGDLSGYEKYATNLVHFWDSNGYLETMMMDRVANNVKELSK